MQAVSDGYANATAQSGPWMLGLDEPSYVAVLTYADNRCVPHLAASLNALGAGEAPKPDDAMVDANACRQMTYWCCKQDSEAGGLHCIRDQGILREHRQQSNC